MPGPKTLKPTTRIRGTERKVGRVANPRSIDPQRSTKVVVTDRMPKRFSAKVVVKNEGDGHRSGFRLRFPGLSLRDQTADPQRGRAGLIGRVLPVELGLIVSHIGAHLGVVLFSEVQNLGNQLRCQLEFLRDRTGDLARSRLAFTMWKSPIRRPTTRTSPSELQCRQGGSSRINASGRLMIGSSRGSLCPSHLVPGNPPE